MGLFKRKCVRCKREYGFCICAKIDAENKRKANKEAKKNPQAGEYRKTKSNSGVDWCTACGCRMMSGKCSNVQCKTRG